MIAALARFFRGVHMVLGISAPEPEHDERKFVLLWLGMVLFFLLFCGGLLWLIPHLYFRS